MLITALKSLAAFSIRKPRTLVAIVAGVLITAALGHYKLVMHERDKLRIASEGYEKAVAAFEERERVLQADLTAARNASRVVAAERNEARRSIDEFRRARRDDPETVAWGAQPIPPGELARMCQALPEMDGCEN